MTTPARLQQDRETADEIVDIGHMRQDVVRHQQVGRDALLAQPRRGFHTEKGDLGRDALFDRRRGDVGRRLHAEHADAAPLEILQQVAVVAGDLHDHRIGAKVETLRHRLGIRFGVAKPALREGAEIDVVAEDALRAFEFLELDKVASAADISVQWIEWLHRPRSLRRNKGVGERRQAKVGEGLVQRGLAEAAMVRGHRFVFGSGLRRSAVKAPRASRSASTCRRI